jgi:hypothetical protein
VGHTLVILWENIICEYPSEIWHRNKKDYTTGVGRILLKPMSSEYIEVGVRWDVSVENGKRHYSPVFASNPISTG